MGDVRIRVSRRLRIFNCPQRVRESLQVRTRVPHPDAASAKARGVAWRGERFYSPVILDRRDVLLPRGLVWLVQDVLRKTGHTADWISNVVGVKGTDPVPLGSMGMIPRPYQEDAIRALHERVQGVVVLPCGGGKTTVGALAILSLGQSALVVVHTTDLVDQWTETLRKCGASRVRIAGAGREWWDSDPLEPGEICVGTVQALATAPDLVRSAAVIVMDECHHAPAKAWSDVLAISPARWRWGLTATPERADGWSFLLGHSFGPVLYERTALELIADGHLRAPRVIPVRVHWSAPKDCYGLEVLCPHCGTVTSTSPKKRDKARCKERDCRRKLAADCESKRGRMIWPAALSNWSDSGEVQRTIKILSMASAEFDRTALVLIPRKRVAGSLERMIRRGGVITASITGDSPYRADILNRVRRGEVQVLVGTQIADEGLDIALADVLIHASCGVAKGLTAQRAGRVCRPEGADIPVIFDLVGDSLGHQWRKRMAAYREAYGAQCIASRKPLELTEAIALAEL